METFVVVVCCVLLFCVLLGGNVVVVLLFVRRDCCCCAVVCASLGWSLCVDVVIEWSSSDVCGWMDVDVLSVDGV